MKFKQIINSFSAWTVDRLTSARRATLTTLATFLIAMTAQTAWAQDPATIGSISYNSTLGAYEINSVDNLKDLAVYVNGSGNYSTTGSETTPHDCQGLTFKMTDNIDYTPSDNNFTPIGGQSTDLYNKFFKGHFDGNGKTISGIRINRNGDSNGFTDCYQGLFGMLNGGEVKNVILDDANITGNNYCAGIVGWNNGGTISNCKVTSSVTIGTCTRDGVNCHGGIAGSNDSGIISGCVSSVQLTTASQQDIIYYGGITGNNNSGTLRDNLVIGASIPAVSGGYYGAITGLSGNESCNYYINCTVAGTANATNVGVGDSKTNGPSDADGARQALTVAIPTNGTPSGTATPYNVSGITGYTGKSGGSSTTENNIILYDNGTTSTYYSGAGETVTFLYNYDGYQVSVTDADAGKVDFTKDIIQTSATNIYHNHTFTMPAKAVTITATDVWGVAGGKDGSTDNKAYTITSTAGLDLLAQNVNAGREYINMYFKLGANITYTHTTDWNDATSTENNFTPIGVDSNAGKNFGGFFDGCNYTISGIRIHSDDDFQGIFAWPQSATAKEIKNIKLANARIKGKSDVGGIVGKFDRTITNCHIASTVAIIATNYNCGGIAGYDGGTYSSIIGCTSAATVSGNNYVGGIAGGIVGSITDCFVTGATVSGTSNVGAIAGFKNTDGTLKNNYYYNSTVNGSAATDAGCNGADVAGARKAYTVTLGTYVSMDGTATAHGTVTNDGDISITSYANNSGIMYTTKSGGTTTSITYAGATETINLTYSGTVAEGCVVGYKVNDGEATAGNTITMPAADATITEVDMALWGNGDGSETNPYVITSTAGLDLLAQKVNGGSGYYGKYFKLGADIEYNKNTANNFTPIGNNNYYFGGTFDGNGKTISGININNSTAEYLGVFGILHGTVENLVVSNCSIVGSSDVGAIAGYLGIATIENCSVSDDVILSGNSYVGGIVGASSKGTIKGCTSAATIIGTNSSDDNANRLGGIVGATLSDSKVIDNLFTGTISDNLKEYIGAIVGENPNGGLDNNLYTSTGLGGRGIASGSEKSTTGADGAGAHKAVEISAAEGVTITPTGTKTTYTVSGITAYTDNNFIGYDSKLYAGATTRATFSITYTVPEGYIFDGIDAGEGVGIVLNEGVYNLAVPASDVTISAKFKNLTMTLAEIEEFEKLAIDPTMQSYVESGALKLSVTPKNKFWTLACGVDLLLPEGIVVYKARMNSAGTKVDLTEISDSELNGVLKANNGVLIASTPGENYDFAVSPKNSVTTLSTDDAKSYGNDNQLVPVLEETHFDSENYFILTDNQFVMVDVSQDTKVPVGKAVLKVPAGTAQARAFGIDANVTTGDTTGINAVLENAGEEVWYNLQGQRISKPTRKGIYILNGKKIRM